jgi:hypothetical protein
LALSFRVRLFMKSYTPPLITAGLPARLNRLQFKGGFQTPL